MPARPAFGAAGSRIHVPIRPERPSTRCICLLADAINTPKEARPCMGVRRGFLRCCQRNRISNGYRPNASARIISRSTAQRYAASNVIARIRMTCASGPCLISPRAKAHMWGEGARILTKINRLSQIGAKFPPNFISPPAILPIGRGNGAIRCKAWTLGAA